ncbi:hypothetical protein ABZ897_22895 [Nonomuraea sp. NPDC046802]|uniref:hypothetical protein n=1 Tax=Nonomuraea sp. NPDC046802 TaxID=3154919 RepID=UPI0033E1C806
MDLKKKVKTKGTVVLSHVDEKAEQSSWTAAVRLGNTYKVAVDCVGPQGKLVIRVTGRINMVRQCIAGYTTLTSDGYPRKKSKVRHLTVEAPPGAKWAVLIVQLP